MTATRQELGQSVWYDSAGTGYVMLDVTEQVRPLAPLRIDDVELMPKDEYHCSLVAARRIADSPESEAAIVRTVRQFLGRETLKFMGVTGELYVCRKGDEMTVIAGADVEGLEHLREEVKRFVPDYDPPFPHVTLLKSANSPYGIGINSNADLEQRCRKLER